MGTYLNPSADNYRQIANGRIFIDKSSLIGALNQVINDNGRLLCVTMPSRFGKTYLALMVSAYYTKGDDSRDIFAKLEAAKAPDYEKHLNKHNVIYLDIAELCVQAGTKDAGAIALSEVKKEMEKAHPGVDFSDCPTLARLLLRAYGATGERFIFVIDEWDYLLRAYPDEPEVFDRYMGFLRSLFKNPSLMHVIELCYMTGIMPIKRYGSMSALNVFEEYTMLGPADLAPYYGFSEAEVLEVMRQSKTSLTLAELKEWYDGYRFPSVGEVYCPNSVVKACKRNSCDSYFADTMADTAITNSLKNNRISLSAESAVLLEGGEVTIKRPKTFGDISNLDTPDKGLIALVHSGFLLFDRENSTVRIPNKEVRGKFSDAIDALKWTSLIERVPLSGAKLIDAVIDCDATRAAATLDEIHYAIAGPFHHREEDNFAVCMRALLFSDSRYMTLSETYTGNGRADLICLPTPQKGKGLPAIVIELKVGQSAEIALKQIKDRDYSSSLKGFDGSILQVGINYDPDSKTHQVKIDRA